MGGFLAAMLDSVLADAAGTTYEKDEFALTLELKTSFLGPATPGRIVGEAQVVKRGRSIGFAEGRLLDENGEIVATATGTFRLGRSG